MSAAAAAAAMAMTANANRTLGSSSIGIGTEASFDTLLPNTTTTTAASPPGVLMVTNATMPPDMVFSDAHVISICGYSVLFVVSASLNLQVLSNLLRAKKHVGLSRLNTLLLQLVLADLLVRETT